MRHPFLICLWFLSCAAIFGCGQPLAPDKSNTSSPTSQPVEAKLNASYDADAGIITVRLQNTGHSPLVVDRDLVFLLHLDWPEDENAPVEFEEEEKTLPRPSADDFNARFVPLQPGESVSRTIDLRKGYTTFRCAVGSSAQKPGRVVMVSGYETVFHLADSSATPARVAISYKVDFYAFHACFYRYTGQDARQIGLFTGPLYTVAENK